jgi:hypothetical protein
MVQHPLLECSLSALLMLLDGEGAEENKDNDYEPCC